MAENRTISRMHVLWHAAVRLPSQHIIQAKILNVTSVGLQFLCDDNLKSGQKYEMQLQVPDLNGSTTTTLVPCFAECIYVILSGRQFRVGAKFSGLSHDHNALILKWSERCAQGVA
ncbi:hypothetical protein AAKU67_000575 [Oxalobacteraceae bacterium GrIS 2.11]